jgi:hypothetical protein
MAENRRLVLGAWLGLALLTTAPFLRAWISPPAETAFSGTFFYWDDFHQYLSFVEQAARGQFLFYNKFDAEPHPPLLVNVEWFVAGRLGALLGVGPVVGFHVLRLLALAALIGGAVRFLARAGFTGARLRWSVLLFATGGGLGWLRYWMGERGAQILDLRGAHYPWHQALSNPHILFGTALLLWTVALYVEWREGTGGRGKWLLAGGLLGLSRPYDLGTFLVVALGVAGIDAVRSREWRRELGRAGSLLWLLPVVVYQALILGVHPSYGQWSGRQNVVPGFPLAELAWGLLPPLAVVILGLLAPSSGVPAPHRRALVVWCCGLAALALLGQTSVLPSFAHQQLSSLGGALLLLAGLLTSARRLPVAVALLSPTAVLLLRSAWTPGPIGFPPREYFAVTEVLERACRPGDVVLADPDVGLMVAGLTPCSVTVGHRVLTPDYARRRRESLELYAETTSSERRREILRRSGARFVVLPVGAGSWLSAEPYRRRRAGARLEVWEAVAQREVAAGPRRSSTNVFHSWQWGQRQSMSSAR